MNSNSYHLNDYPHVNTALAHYGPEAIKTIGGMVEKFYQYRETRELIKGNLAILEQRFKVFDKSRQTLEEAHKMSQALFKDLIQLARENPQVPEITQMILPAYIHMVNSTPNFMKEGLLYLDKMSPQNPIS